MRTLASYCGIPLVTYSTLLAITSSTLEAAELFVSDRATNRILSFDETTGEFLRVLTDTGLDEPTGLAFGPDGYLYVSNLQSGFPESEASVVKIDPVTGATTPFITDIVGAGGIAYHAPSNTLFVSEFGDFDGDEVFHYDASGTLLQSIGTGSAATGRAGMTFDAAGNLYVSEANFTETSASPATVLKYDAANNFAPLGPFASGASVTLNIPAPASGFNGLAFDAAGDLFVASLLGQAVIKFTVDGGVVTGGSQFGAPIPYPSGILLESDGNLLVTSLGNNNPGDPIYGSFLFPGNVSRFDASSGSSELFINGLASADLDGNGSVDEDDLADWQSAYAVNESGDIDADGDTDGRDFLAWQRSFGVQSALQPTGIVRYELIIGATNVPEPASLLLVLIGVATLTTIRQRSNFRIS